MGQELSWEEFVHAVSDMADATNRNAYQIYGIFMPIVADLCERTAAQDEVEHCFDTLLDHAYNENVLGLFKKLSRHYYKIYPDSVLFYVKSCIEM